MTKTIFRKIALEVKLILFNFFTQVPFVYMERAGFMTCTAASHQGAIKEPAASLFRTCEAHPIYTCSYLFPNLWNYKNNGAQLEKLQPGLIAASGPGKKNEEHIILEVNAWF